MPLTIEFLIHIAAFSAGISSLIILSYLSFFPANKGPRLGLILVLAYTVNYFAGILFYVEDVRQEGSFWNLFLGIIQLLSALIMLYAGLRVIEKLGEPRFAFFSMGVKGMMILPIGGICLLLIPLEWMEKNQFTIILLAGIYLWCSLFFLSVKQPLKKAIRLTGLIGYGVFIPWIALEKFLPQEQLLLQLAGAVTFLFQTTSAIIFSILYLAHQGKSTKRADHPENLLPYRLTEREQEVLELLKKSCSYKEIAYQLGITMATVKTHVSHVYKKTGTKGRSELKYRFRETD